MHSITGDSAELGLNGKQCHVIVIWGWYKLKLYPRIARHMARPIQRLPDMLSGGFRVLPNTVSNCQEFVCTNRLFCFCCC